MSLNEAALSDCGLLNPVPLVLTPKESTRAKLTGKSINGQLLDVQDPKENVQLQRIISGEDNRPMKPLPNSIEDVVTPWHKSALKLTSTEPAQIASFPGHLSSP